MYSVNNLMKYFKKLIRESVNTLSIDTLPEDILST